MRTQNTGRVAYKNHLRVNHDTSRCHGVVDSADGRRLRHSFLLNNKLFKISFIAFVVLFFCVAGILNITAEGSERAVEKQYRSVQVEEGDTLWSIALEYNDEELSKSSTKDYIEDVVSINNLVRDDKITAGNYIIVPVYVVED